MPWLFHVIVFTIVALIIYARHMKRVLAGHACGQVEDYPHAIRTGHACILRSWWSGDLSTVDGPTRVFTFPFYRSRVRVNASLDCDVDGCDIAKWGLDLKDPSAGMSDQFPRHSCFSMPHIRFVRDDFGFAAGAHQVHIAAASDDDLRDMLSSRPGARLRRVRQTPADVVGRQDGESAADRRGISPLLPGVREARRAVATRHREAADREPGKIAQAG